MKNYANEIVKYKGCPGCAYANHEFELPCGMAYENDNFTLAQDWELPIPGFMIVSPKRHIEKLEELGDDERNALFNIVNKTIKILRNNSICDRFDVIFEEKENKHFHVWIMPRYEWMNKICDDIIHHVDVIMNYAKENFRTKEIYNEIEQASNIIKEQINL